MAVDITVRSDHTVTRLADLGTVLASVHLSRASPAEAMAAVAASTRRLRARLEEARASGAVTRWSGDQLHTWVQRRDEYGERRRTPSHHARSGLAATFADPGALAHLLADAAEVPGFHVSGVSWELTDEHRAECEREARQGAVRAAVVRAQDYADALLLGDVQVVAVDDDAPGRDVDWEDGDATAFELQAASAGADDEAEVPVAPRTIHVRAAVRARFVAG